MPGRNLTTKVRGPRECADTCILAAPEDDQERKVQAACGGAASCSLAASQALGWGRGRSPAPKEGTA